MHAKSDALGCIRLHFGIVVFLFGLKSEPCSLLWSRPGNKAAADGGEVRNEEVVVGVVGGAFGGGLWG